MEVMYEIPREENHQLHIGNWVEIFEAYMKRNNPETVRVKRMRVGGKTMTFARQKGSGPHHAALHPHEGEVVYIDRGPDRTWFGIRLSP